MASAARSFPLRLVVAFLGGEDVGHVVVCKHELAVGQPFDSQAFELFEREPGKLAADCCHAAFDRRHPFRQQLGSRGGQRGAHGRCVGIVEHRAVGDVGPRNMEESAARHLTAADEHVVARCRRSVETQTAQQFGHHGGEAGECRDNLVAAGYIAEHDVVHVGIDGAPAAATPDDVNAVAAAVVKIHLHVEP